MWRQWPTVHAGMQAAMAQVVRLLRPGGLFVSVSDVAHPDGPLGDGAAAAVREFLPPAELAVLLSAGGELEWASEPRFFLPERPDSAASESGNGEDVEAAAERLEAERDGFLDPDRCLRIRSAWDKPNMTSHPLAAANLHTCEELPEGPLRLLVAKFVLRKPVDE
mmetsp:Transcript_86362/g.230686  ORF Transcript_86362/g.230686 Transcript_86362/m.230686 type:complete len:165 (+) Transcript_86362:394-888(+)